MSATITANVVAERVSRGLRRRWHLQRYALTWASRLLGMDPRSLKNHFEAVNAPRAAELVRMMVEVDEVADEIIQLVNEARARRAGGIACSLSASKSDGAALEAHSD